MSCSFTSLRPCLRSPNTHVCSFPFERYQYRSTAGRQATQTFCSSPSTLSTPRKPVYRFLIPSYRLLYCSSPPVMASSSTRVTRLARLSKLVQSDLASLPDRAPSPPPFTDPESASDNDTPGGVSLLTTAPDSPTNPAPTISTDAKSISPPVQPSSTEGQLVSAPLVTSSNDERRFVWLEGAPSTYNLSAMPNQPPCTIHLPPSTLKKGDIATEKFFSPLLALSKYPYKFCNKGDSQDIASAFFDAGKFWAHEWDLYYVWDIEESKPLILVGESQFEVLLKEINSALNLSLSITSQQREEGLVNRFPDHPRFQPRYLGRSKSKEDYNHLIDNVPGVMSRPPNEPQPPAIDDRSLAEFKRTIEKMWDQTKAKGKAAKEKKKVERLAKQKVFADQFKRAQRYLGLRQAKQGHSAEGMPAAIDVSSPAPFPFDQSVVFICVDVESYERDHDKITEIGIATLDTRDLVGVPPGEDGEKWRSLIHARHFRIQEYGHLINSQYVHGCPDRFDFGTSEWVQLRDSVAKVAECFQEPFCGARATNSNLQLQQRNLIFLGHDTLGDVRYLQSMGFDPLALPNVLETQDTAVMYRVWRRDLQQSNLGRILYDFDIPGFNLHNAGNDAVFTVQAMLGICVREASIRSSSKLKMIRDEDRAAKAAAAVEEARSRVLEEDDGWDMYEADGDGGEPVKSNMQPKQAPTPTFSTFLPIHQSGGRGRGRDGGYRGPNYMRPSEYSQQSNNRGQQNRGRGQGHGRGHGRGRGHNSPSRSSDSTYGTQKPEQQNQHLWW